MMTVHDPMKSSLRYILGALGAAAGLAWAAGAWAEPEPATIFARLEDAQARERARSERAGALDVALGEQHDRIGEVLEQVEVTRRATRTMRRRLLSRQIAWDRVGRAARRGGVGQAPGQSADTQALLERARRAAWAERREELALVRQLGQGRARVRELVGRRGRLIVELAQHRAGAEAAGAGHDRELERARQAPAERIDRDLARTDEQLARQLGLMLQNPSERDFHRLKGTLLPPVRAEPTHTYGPRRQRASASYVRHTGYTYGVEVGTEVRAAADGLVAYAQRFEGFGRVLILDHGGDYHTVYAHLDGFEVSCGARSAPWRARRARGQGGRQRGLGQPGGPQAVLRAAPPGAAHRPVRLVHPHAVSLAYGRAGAAFVVSRPRVPRDGALGYPSDLGIGGVGMSYQ